MKMAFLVSNTRQQSRRGGFSLIEVVLAIGIFLITVLALVGLLGPTLQSVDEVEKTDEVASVVNTINAFLQNSPEIANSDETKFETIYDAIAGDGYATILVFRKYASTSDDTISLKVGFVGETSAQVQSSDIRSGSTVLAAGTVFRAVLTPSSVIPDDQITDNGEDEFPRYTLSSTLEDYPEGYLAMEVRIYAEEPDILSIASDLDDLSENSEPIFTYNTAIVR
jgi:type II secretory pathway pseudopilin PulG